MPKPRHRISNKCFWDSSKLSLIAGAFELLASLPSSSADDLIYGRLSRDYPGRDGGGGGGGRRYSSNDGGTSDRRQHQSSPDGRGYLFGQQPLVHTFETQGSCMRRCALPCVIQNVEDLMMPRWICPSQVCNVYFDIRSHLMPDSI